MIRVDRTKAAPSARWLRRAAQATSTLSSEVGRRGRSRLHGQMYRDPGLWSALEELFGRKCAYCETSLVTDMHLDQFRPASAAVNLDGTTVQPAYWWLTYAWENLYLACSACSRNKRDRFPVAGERVTTPDGALETERAILLDPCADDPELHLLFAETGHVASRSAVEDGVDRGAVTIDVFGLNRPRLVEERAAAAKLLTERFRLAVASSTISGSSAVKRILAAVVDVQKPYVALQRQLAARLAEITIGLVSPGDDPERAELLVLQQAHEEDLRRTSVEVDADGESRRSLAIDAIELENFRGIERLELRLGGGTPEHAGWTMLLGENGVGKSSVLQALAIALMGADRLDALGSDAQPRDLLRRGAEEGRIRVFFAADPEPLEVRLRPDEIVFDDAARRPRMIVLGFGSARWLPRPGGFEPDGDEFVRIRNLFNPFVPLADTIGWLCALDDERFSRLEDTLLRLLELDGGERLVRRSGDVLVVPRTGALEEAVSLRQLSDGYQSVMAMVGDVLDLLGRKRVDMAAAEGLVLVDEVGSHLHPRWRMQVVSRLRGAFPRLQFVASTHDPLCLRGLREGEVRLLRRDSHGRIVPLDELPSVEALRADQLLTSPYFGLHTTLDPELDARFEAYYELLAQDELTMGQRRRMLALRDELEGHRVLGSTRRERAMLEAIDRHLAREADALADGAGERLGAETRAALEQILSRVDAEL